MTDADGILIDALGFQQNGDTFTVTGSGDIAPAVPGGAVVGTTIAQTLTGTFAGLIVVVVVATDVHHR